MQDSAHEPTRITELVFPEHTNHYGTLFGGHALSLMDKAAFIAATRYCRKTVVTVSTEQIDFHAPVRQGQLAEAIAEVISTGRTSLKVQVTLYSEDLLSGARDLCTKGIFVMVSVDKQGTPAPLA